MFAIPLSMIGVIWGHLVVGMDFNMQSLIGVISLAGIVVNDSILMMEFIRMREEQGGDAFEAAPKAAADRFRSIMLTSVTTIAGLIPLLAEKSLQAQMLIPLALSLVCGLATSTLLVLFVIPTLYGVIVDFRKK
jgi:multidrug efflux pump subunit AcrB